MNLQNIYFIDYLFDKIIFVINTVIILIPYKIIIEDILKTISIKRKEIVFVVSYYSKSSGGLVAELGGPRIITYLPASSS